MKQRIGRYLSFVECRESMGLGAGGALAQRATISESGRDVVAIAMGPGRRHITKPVCEITYALREEGIDTSVLVVNAGSGVPADSPDMTVSCFGLEDTAVQGCPYTSGERKEPHNLQGPSDPQECQHSCDNRISGAGGLRRFRDNRDQNKSGHAP